MATYKHWQLTLGGAAAGAAAVWRWGGTRNNAVLATAAAVTLGAWALEEANVALVAGDPALKREEQHRRDRYRLRLYVWDLDRRKIVFPRAY